MINSIFTQNSSMNKIQLLGGIGDLNIQAELQEQGIEPCKFGQHETKTNDCSGKPERKKASGHSCILGCAFASKEFIAFVSEFVT